MFHRLIEEMVQKQGVTEQLKAEQPMEWIGLMNNIQAYAREIVNNEIIFSQDKRYKGEDASTLLRPWLYLNMIT